MAARCEISVNICNERMSFLVTLAQLTRTNGATAK
jgi:hypothetical protein